MKKTSIFGNVKKTFALVAQNKSNFFFSVTSDFLFLVIFAIVFTTIQIRIMDYLYKLVEIVQSDMAQLSVYIADKSGAVELLMQQPEFVYNLGEAFRWLAILMVVTYLIWGFFQGLAWMYCIKIVDKDYRGILSYLIRFFLINLVWVSLFYAFVYTWVRLSVHTMFSLFPIISQDMVTGLFLSSTLALAYFALVSYPLLKTTTLNNSFQKTLLFGITQYKRLLLIFLLLIVAAVGIGILYFLLFKTTLLLFALVSILVVLPLITVIRLFVTLTVLESA